MLKVKTEILVWTVRVTNKSNKFNTRCWVIDSVQMCADNSSFFFFFYYFSCDCSSYSFIKIMWSHEILQAFPFYNYNSLLYLYAALVIQQWTPWWWLSIWGCHVEAVLHPPSPVLFSAPLGFPFLISLSPACPLHHLFQIHLSTTAVQETGSFTQTLPDSSLPIKRYGQLFSFFWFLMFQKTPGSGEIVYLA